MVKKVFLYGQMAIVFLQDMLFSTGKHDNSFPVFIKYKEMFTEHFFVLYKYTDGIITLVCVNKRTL